MTFTVATWNINSVRLRIGLVVRYLAEHRPDVLCLQETKCPDGNFPFGAFRDAGYPHIAINGQKGSHGVAIVSRLPLETFSKRDFCAKGDARHLHAILGGPGAGPRASQLLRTRRRRRANPEINVKFAHKLAFVDEMVDWARDEKPAAQRSILVGDLNIAPLEHDVWSHKSLLNVVSHTPIEVDKLTQAQAAGPWVDALRKFVPDNEKLYTWWSYRSPDWQKANKGRRLDHIWVSPALGDSVKGIGVSARRPRLGAPIRPRAGYDKIGIVAVATFSEPASSCDHPTLDPMGGECWPSRWLALATLVVATLFYRAMPAYLGAERLPGLSSEARVWRDAYGVPHVFASSMDDAARALGYLHASERMFQMDILRRVGQGRMAEIRRANSTACTTSSFARSAPPVRPKRPFCAVALGSEAARGLCRGRQRFPGKPRAAARVPPRG